MIDNHYITLLKTRLNEGNREIFVTGLSGTAAASFMAELIPDIRRPMLILLPKAKDAARFHRQLEFFLPKALVFGDNSSRRLYDFPLYDISPLTGLSPHRNITNRRLQALYALTAEDSPVITSSLEAALLKVVPQDSLIKTIEYLETGKDISRELLIRKLEAGGYIRTSLVEEAGDYSVRGGVIDIFSPLYSMPVRLEFWGDRLESIRHFDSITQRSEGKLNEMILLPASEIILDEEALKRARSMGRLPEQFMDGGSFPGQEAWLNHFYAKPESLFDYFSSNSVISLIDFQRIDAEKQAFTDNFHKDLERHRQEAEERGTPFPETEDLILTGEDFDSRVRQHQSILVDQLTVSNPEGGKNLIEVPGVKEIDFDLEVSLSGRGRVSMAPLAEKIAEWQGQGARTVLVCSTQQQAARLREILNNYDLKVDEIAENWYGATPGRKTVICLGRLSRGFAWEEIGLRVITEDEIFGPKRTRYKKKGTDSGLDWTSLGRLEIDDLVVHEDHGIGKYGGLTRMEVDKKVNDFAIIEYADNDRLYIPADRISIIQKYVGADEKNPKLDRLGGRSWKVVKQKAKKAIREIAKQLVDIYAVRKYRKGFAFSRPDNYFREFEAAFEYEETPDQIKAIDDVLSDMESERPMDRLICGDVGFGKTEVAIRAAFKAVSDGKQAAMLVPTTVLAEQHYETIKKRMEPYGVRVDVLSRFRNKKEQREIAAKVRGGMVDLIIGTHRILSKDMGFKDLGLLIIDEEQRFGVKQKERLKDFRALVDVLALTATPIPRTLHLSLMGVRDLSIIETPPEDRLAIQTSLSTYDENVIKKAIEDETGRNGQVFFVHNRVQSIQDVAAGLRKLVPEARFAVAHGQMSGHELEKTMMRFLKKEIDVLVCTTIIESGLDIPSANTIIINQIERFGLSQIYQLRGRVGRSSENAFAYLLLSKNARLTREAEKRLKAMMDFSQLGAGINLAMHDLKIRGGGNILGFSQSGHIASIGYELYMKLTEQAIAELRGDEYHEEVNPEINVDISAYLPEEYVSDTDVRLNIYRRLSALREHSDLENIIDEIADRFGPAPDEVSNLFRIMKARLYMKAMGISRLDIKPGFLLFTFSPGAGIAADKLVAFIEKNRPFFSMLPDSRLKARIKEAEPLDALSGAMDVMKKINFFQSREI